MADCDGVDEVGEVGKRPAAGARGRKKERRSCCLRCVGRSGWERCEGAGPSGGCVGAGINRAVEVEDGEGEEAAEILVGCEQALEGGRWGREGREVWQPAGSLI